MTVEGLWKWDVEGGAVEGGAVEGGCGRRLWKVAVEGGHGALKVGQLLMEQSVVVRVGGVDDGRAAQHASEQPGEHVDAHLR